MNQSIGETFHKKAKEEHYEVVKSLMICKLTEGKSMCSCATNAKTLVKVGESQCEL